MASSTKKKYQAYWNQWGTYATKHGMRQLPAAPTDVALFLAHLAQKGRKSVCSAAVTSISWHHNSAGFFFTFNFTSHKSNILWRQKTVRRSSESNGAYNTRIIEKTCSRPCCSLDDWQFTCYCLISFFGLLRYNDVIQLRVQDFQFQQGNLVIFLNSSKTDQFRAGSNIFLSNNTNDVCLCPVTTARAFLSLFSGAGAGPSTSVLAYTTGLDKLVPHAVMLSRLRLALKPFVKFPSKFGLHSFRSGEPVQLQKQTCLEILSPLTAYGNRACVIRYIKASDKSRFRVTQAMAAAAQKSNDAINLVGGGAFSELFTQHLV